MTPTMHKMLRDDVAAIVVFVPAMAAIAAVTVTVHRKLSRVWPRVEFPSDLLNEGPVARKLIDCAKTGTAVCTLQVIEVTSFRISPIFKLASIHLEGRCHLRMKTTVRM